MQQPRSGNCLFFFRYDSYRMSSEKCRLKCERGLNDSFQTSVRDFEAWYKAKKEAVVKYGDISGDHEVAQERLEHLQVQTQHDLNLLRHHMLRHCIAHTGVVAFITISSVVSVEKRMLYFAKNFVIRICLTVFFTETCHKNGTVSSTSTFFICVRRTLVKANGFNTIAIICAVINLICFPVWRPYLFHIAGNSRLYKQMHLFCDRTVVVAFSQLHSMSMFDFIIFLRFPGIAFWGRGRPD